MSLTTLCRLCICTSHDCKQLFDINGQSNSAYDIASKYFDPMLLNPGHEDKISVICTECWQHINDFFMFQQSIYTAQLKWDDIKGMIVPVVKLEEQQIDDTNPNNNEEQCDVLFRDDLKDEVHLSDIDAFDITNYNTLTSDDDDRALVEHFTKTRKKRMTKKKLKNNENPISGEKKKASTRKTKKLKRDLQTKKDLKGIRLESKNNSRIESDNNNPSSKSEKPSYLQQKTLENDAFIASWRSELDCEICNATFPNFTLLRKHFVQEHSKDKFYILCCERRFSHRYHIVEHIRLHMDPNAYRCDICGRCSTNSRNLAKHIKELHTEEGKQRNFECTVCQKSMANKTSLRIHMETHETNLTHKCKECGKGFPSEQRRNLHERTVHHADRICDQCGKTLHGPYAMKQHLLEHAGVEKRKWPCDQCKAELHSHSSLKRHKLFAHHDGSTVYVCSDCGKVCTTEMSLRSHKKNVHQAERKHKCTICEKGFKFPKVLREHMATHTGEDLYQCSHCTKTFKTNANMHHHRKKAHPKEWAEARINRTQGVKVDLTMVQNEVIM